MNDEGMNFGNRRYKCKYGKKSRKRKWLERVRDS